MKTRPFQCLVKEVTEMEREVYVPRIAGMILGLCVGQTLVMKEASQVSLCRFRQDSSVVVAIQLPIQLRRQEGKGMTCPR